MMAFPVFPTAASNHAPRVDALYLSMVGLSLFMTLGIVAFTLYFAVKYRRGSKADRSNPVANLLLLELSWIGIPAVIFIVIFVWSSSVYLRLYQAPRDARDIYIIGKQWMWKAQHENGRREIDELHVPVGVPIKLTMASQDVIHSFYVPAFRIKQDVLPGRYTTVWFTATKTGEYHLFCAEYCGTHHANMEGRVIVMDEASYQSWLSADIQNTSMAAAGQVLFQSLGCSGCHTPGATVRAPLLTGAFGNPVALQSGEVVNVDENYVRDSILLPQKQIVAGFAPIMPSFQGQISETQLQQLLAYIKSIGARQEEVQ